jgi:hypothetical protein
LSHEEYKYIFKKVVRDDSNEQEVIEAAHTDLEGAPLEKIKEIQLIK